MNGIGQQIFDILKSELSEVTAKSILAVRCKAAGKDPDTLTSNDVKDIEPKILAGVLLFGGEEKAKTIKEKLRKLH
ncbi:MAG: hypothetical protein AABY58_03030 [Nitrospirota bacterium]